MKIIKATAPSAWATYLINGDDSGISAQDKAAADAFVSREFEGYSPASCEDAGFIKFHDARAECPLAADCQTYTALVPHGAAGLFSRRGAK